MIVNDGSKDKTLEKLIENFDLIQVPYNYIEKIHTQPFRRLFKSMNPEYSKLVVVDKENGGTKADAVNAGLNVASYPYFINTDVDCILSKKAILHCVIPFINDKDVIAVSGIMSVANGCHIDHCEITEPYPPKFSLPLFQTVEYMRSFLVGKMGWSSINAMHNVSGGYGMFKTQTCIDVGGYGYDSFAEDMDMLWRLVTYSCDFEKKYKVIQIPQTCCWTEVPSNLKILYRQRTRWGRGLIQTFVNHRRLFFNKKYRQLGLLTIPYMFFFELLAPIIEFIGLIVLLYLAFTGGVNWYTAWIIFGAVFVFNFLVSITIILYDWLVGPSYRKLGSYFKLVLAAILEPFIYHPLIVVFSLIGYGNYLFRKEAKWGEMSREGISNKMNDANGKETIKNYGI